MKMVLAVYNVAIQDEVTEALVRRGVTAFTRWPQVLGAGPTTGPRLDDAVWPGANAATMVVVSDEQAPGLMDALQQLRDTVGKTEGLQAYLLDVEGGLR